MQLVAKGASAEVGSFKQLLCTMKWTTAADFDLAAVYETDDGLKMVYFGDKGSLNTTPFIQLDEDSGVGDSGGNNEENLRITKMDGKKKVHLVAWDYGAITKGTAARFANSDVHLEVKDDTGTSHDVTLNTGETGNCACLATIEVTPLGAKLVNSSNVHLFKSFPKNANDFRGLVE
ncbi:MAG: hypothetical protein ACE5KG_04715 [Nitrososphaerales archaeon]